MVWTREISDCVFLPAGVDPQEEDTEKSLNFDEVSEFRYYFFTEMSYNPQLCTINLGVYDLVIVIIFIFEEWLVVVLSGWQSNWLRCFFCVKSKKKIKDLARKGLNSQANFEFQPILAEMS